MKIGIVGSGTMGIGLAQLFLEKNMTVVLKSMNGNHNKAKSKIEKNLEKLVSKEVISEEKKDNIFSNLVIDLYDDQIKDCDFIIEAVSEDMNIKKSVFSYLDDICDEKCIFATNTSSLSITELAAYTRRPEKFIGMHFFNPARIMKLVEIIKALQTSEQTFEVIKNLVLEIDKEPVQVEEAPGFIVNRMLIPMINEAICILSEGVASVEDIDKAMMFGANHPIGPLALCDLIGLDVCLSIMDTLFEETKDSKYRANSLLRKYVRVGWLGRKSRKGFYIY